MNNNTLRQQCLFYGKQSLCASCCSLSWPGGPGPPGLCVGLCSDCFFSLPPACVSLNVLFVLHVWELHTNESHHSLTGLLSPLSLCVLSSATVLCVAVNAFFVFARQYCFCKYVTDYVLCCWWPFTWFPVFAVSVLLFPRHVCMSGLPVIRGRRVTVV